jgi:hypothetical protein
MSPHAYYFVLRSALPVYNLRSMKSLTSILGDTTLLFLVPTTDAFRDALLKACAQRCPKLTRPP